MIGTLTLRTYQAADGEFLLDWMEDETTFVKWCGNHFRYPLTREQLRTYQNANDGQGDSLLFTAAEEGGRPVGHLLVKDITKESAYFGHIILAPEYRNRGWGKELLRQGLQYAFSVLKVPKVTLTVFDSNPSAYQCYKSVGFRSYQTYPNIFPFHEEKWGVCSMERLPEE